MIGRRSFLTGSAVVVTTIAAHRGGLAAVAEPPPETTRVRLGSVPSICLSPQYVAEDLLRAEGFTEIRYQPSSGGLPGAKEMGAGNVDIAMNFAAPLVVALDGGTPIVLLAGVHVGCFELFATDRVRAIRDLKGKTVAVFGLESAQHIFLASMATLVGLDPRKDINWVAHPPAEAKRLLAEGKVDAFLGFPPDPQELRARKIGHVVVNSATDRPWSQYFCCMVVANREFVAQASGRDQARPARHPEGGRGVRPGPGSGGARVLATAASTYPSPLVLQALKEVPLRPVARVRPGGYAPLLRPAPPRGGDDQGQSAEDPRAGHRLAIPERAEEGAEGMMERRAVLRALSAGVVGSVIGARSGFAAEPPPETVRLRTTTSNIGICVVGPKIVAEALWRAEGFTDVQYQPRPGEGLGLRLAALASGATDIEHDVRFVPDPEDRRRRPHRDPRRAPRGLLRAVRRTTRPRDSRPEGEDRRRERGRRSGPRLHREHAGVRWPGRPQRRPLGHRGPCGVDRAVRRTAR